MGFDTTLVGFGKPIPSPQRVENALEVRRGLEGPAHRLAGRRVNEAERLGVEHEPWRLRERVRVVADVDLLSEEWVPGLGEVDADLVRAPGLEAAGDEAHATEALEHLDVRHRVLPRSLGCVPAALLVFDAPAEPVAAIFDEVALVARFPGNPVHEREVAPLDRVRPKLRGELLLRGPGSREDEEPARVFVDAVHDPEAWSSAACAVAIREECTDA